MSAPAMAVLLWTDLGLILIVFLELIGIKVFTIAQGIS